MCSIRSVHKQNLKTDLLSRKTFGATTETTELCLPKHSLLSLGSIHGTLSVTEPQKNTKIGFHDQTSLIISGWVGSLCHPEITLTIFQTPGVYSKMTQSNIIRKIHLLEDKSPDAFGIEKQLWDLWMFQVTYITVSSL